MKNRNTTLSEYFKTNRKIVEKGSVGLWLCCLTPLGHIILILSQPVFHVSPYCWVLSGEATNTNFIVDWGSNSRFTALVASTLTITPPMLSSVLRRK